MENKECNCPSVDIFPELQKAAADVCPTGPTGSTGQRGRPGEGTTLENYLSITNDSNITLNQPIPPP